MVKANKNDSKNIVVITLSVATALICIALTFWGNWKNNGVLTTDAFIGVIATFIGVCATIIVGVQIVNHLELRNLRASIKAVEEERKEMEYQQEAFSVEMYNTRLSIGNALALMALEAKDKDVVMEFTALTHSVIIDDWSSMRGSVLLSRYKRLAEIASGVIETGNLAFLEDTLNRLSVLVIPKDIDCHDEIMSLHYGLMSDIKRIIQRIKSENVSK